MHCVMHNSVKFATTSVRFVADDVLHVPYGLGGNTVGVGVGIGVGAGVGMSVGIDVDEELGASFCVPLGREYITAHDIIVVGITTIIAIIKAMRHQRAYRIGKVGGVYPNGSRVNPCTCRDRDNSLVTDTTHRRHIGHVLLFCNHSFKQPE